MSSPLKSSPPKTERIVFQPSFFRSGFVKLPSSIRSTVLTVAGYHFLVLPLVGWGIYEKKYHVTYLKAGFWDFKSLQTYTQFFELFYVFMQACRPSVSWKAKISDFLPTLPAVCQQVLVPYWEVKRMRSEEDLQSFILLKSGGLMASKKLGGSWGWLRWV